MTEMAADADDRLDGDGPQDQDGQGAVHTDEPADESRPAEAAEVSEPQQATQESLFSAEAATRPADEPDDDVTSFNQPDDDLAAVRADLSQDAEEPLPLQETAPEDGDEPAPPEEPAEMPVPADASDGMESDDATAEMESADAEAPLPAGPPAEHTAPEPVEAATAVIEAAEVAQEEAAAALVEAGEPAGADDEPDAVEALLDAETEAGVLQPEPRDGILTTPFIAYVVVWLLFTIAMVVVLADAAKAGTLDSATAYPLFVFGGLFLTVLGPVMSVLLWGVKRSRSPQGERAGLFATALLRGSLATFAGVALWWIGIIALNYLKTGRLF